jgi:indolepyruvate ferredoxin oxidoreductase beta subunit
VDVLAATELLETGRAIRNGLVTPERTLLIASTQRAYTTAEKLAMGDGRFDPERLREAAQARAQHLLLLDLAGLARAAGAPLNAVLAGALAGCGRLPIPPDAFRAGIRAEGKAAEANLRGFEAGLAAATQPPESPVSSDGQIAAESAAVPLPVPPRRARTVDALLERVHAEFPLLAQPVLELGVRRLVDYQNVTYASLYLARLAVFRAVSPALLEAVARHLAVRMSYEDAIRVAQAKTRPERLARIRAETGAVRGDVVTVTEFLKPGLEEVSDILPVPLARALLKLGQRWPRLGRWRPGMYVRTTTVWGYTKLRLLAALRLWRRGTWRYRHEQTAIESWLEHVARAAARDERLALEIAECARLIKGYGDTHKRGSANYARIEAVLIRPALGSEGGSAAAATAIARARAAALADPEGAALQAMLERA